MGKRYKNFRNGKFDNNKFNDEWGVLNEDRRREKQSNKGKKYNRRNRRNEKLSNFKDFL